MSTTVGEIRALIANLPDETPVVIDPGFAGTVEDAEYNGVLSYVPDSSGGGDYVEYDEDEHGVRSDVFEAVVIG